MWNWLVRQWQWPAAALFTAAFLLALTPLLAVEAGAPLALVFVQLPIYMLHQWEEHAGDRFRQYVNRVIGRGREALTPAATFWINALGVWAVDLAALYLAWAIGPATGLTAGYLALINAALHIGPAIARCSYNPGLVTACLLFIPLGACCVALAGSNCTWHWHAAGLAAAIAVHIAIIAVVVARLTHGAPHFARLPLPPDPSQPA
jgi:hypothetical protein